MIGVKGCGKSRTCMDIGATRPCLYFEGIQHTDLNWVLSKLQESSETDYDALSLNDFLSALAVCCTNINTKQSGVAGGK